VETSPFRFNRDDIAKRIDGAKADGDGLHGPRIALEASSMPTIGLHVERLASGARTHPYRTIANIVFNVMEGNGESLIGGQTFAWQRGDTFVAPCWTPISHNAVSDAQLFAMSDEPLLRYSNYYRMEPIA
jgi:gentisate 1,2-dioxygenase